jgi:DNA invertase Pin-like site-specific DNA recombinase
MSLHILNLGGQTIDTATPTGNFFITVMAGAAELERNLIRERCQEGRNKRQKEGRRIGEIPYGWDFDKATNTLVINDQERKTIQRIFQLRREGMTLRAISEALNKDKIPSKKNGKWTHTQVHRLLKRDHFGIVEQVHSQTRAKEA